jgi:hypothetical protein
MFAPRDTREEVRKQWPERADGRADDADVELDYELVSVPVPSRKNSPDLKRV